MTAAIALGIVAVAIMVWAVVTTDLPVDNVEPIEMDDDRSAFDADRWGHHAAQEDRD
jgi:hypothetical protein